MSAIINETQFWWCAICDKTSITKSKRNIISSKGHKHKKIFGSDVKDYEFINPDNNKMKYIHNDTIKDCRKFFFHSSEYRSLLDIKITKMEENDEVF